MALPPLNDFCLAGGTALALYYGHRLSVDLDLFSLVDFQPEELIPVLENNFPDFTYSRPNTIGIFGFIGNVKVDFIRYHFHLLISSPYIEDDLRLLSTDDIAAMKIEAVLKRAVKKDFWDIAELLDHYSVDELINCHTVKYPSHQLLISVPQALTYFIDADDSEDPVSLKGQTWKGIKKKILQKINAFLI